MRRKYTFLLLFSWFSCLAGEDEFYRKFLSIVGTNEDMLQLTSSLLVDTNNAAPRLTNNVFNLARLQANGELSGIRLGMRMEEVVAAWGKPRDLYSKCLGGGPRFFYEGSTFVDFESGANSAKEIHASDWPDSTRPPRERATVQDCLVVFSKPSRRVYSGQATHFVMIYAGTNSVTEFQCYKGLICGIDLRRPPAPIQRDKQL